MSIIYAMPVKSDSWIIRMCREQGMIEPFLPELLRNVEGRRIISAGASSYGYDIRLSAEHGFKIFSPVYAGIVDPKHFDERTLLDVFADAPSTDLSAGHLDDGGPLLVDLLAETGLVGSKSQARTTVTQGGAYVNNSRQDDVTRRLTAADLVAGRYVVLRRGKKDHHLVRFA